MDMKAQSGSFLYSSDSSLEPRVLSRSSNKCSLSAQFIVMVIVSEPLFPSAHDILTKVLN
jgi:hypothetical protein